MIKGILLDYGGTIDSNGVHWGELLWSFYQQHNVPVSKEAFRNAYVHGERTLALQPLVKTQHNYYEVLRIKAEVQLEFLKQQNLLPQDYDSKTAVISIADAGNHFAAASVEKAKPVLASLRANYPLALVSNFYGNVNAVLEAYGIRHFFQHVVESAVVNVRKPDPRIFSLGADALRLPADDCLVVGDSYRKDVEPAKAAGCRTVWLRGEGWETDPETPVAADHVVENFSDVLGLLPLFSPAR